MVFFLFLSFFLSLTTELWWAFIMLIFFPSVKLLIVQVRSGKFTKTNIDKFNGLNFTWDQTTLWTRTWELAGFDIYVPTEWFWDEGQQGSGFVLVAWTCVLTIKVLAEPQLLSADSSRLSVSALTDLSAQVQVAAFSLAPRINKKLLSVASRGTPLFIFLSPTFVCPASPSLCPRLL